jgi:septum site-determining protein MinC
MSAATSGLITPSFEIKSAQLPLIVLLLKSTRLNDVATELEQRYGHSPDFFAYDPLLIDLSALHDSDEVPEWSFLLPLLRRYYLVPVAVKGGNHKQMQSALQAGLAQAEDLLGAAPPINQPAAPPVPPASTEPTLLPALIIERPLRSGQQVYARGRDLVMLGVVNPGAEVIADGHIHVLAPLRGKAIAGARGCTEARIFTTSLEAELISIAGIYRTSETPLPVNVHGKAAQVRLEISPDGEKLLIDPIV